MNQMSRDHSLTTLITTAVYQLWTNGTSGIVQEGLFGLSPSMRCVTILMSNVQPGAVSVSVDGVTDSFVLSEQSLKGTDGSQFITPRANAC